MQKTDKASNNRHQEDVSLRSLKVAIAVFIVFLVILCGLLIRTYFTLKKERLLSMRELSLSMFVAKHGPLTAADVGVIRPWMTFDYVNRSFGLPPDFLKTTFDIADPGYPKLTLSRYATEEGFNQAEFMNSIQAAVAHYLAAPH